MGQKRRDAVGGSELVKRGNIGRIDGLGLAAARVAREERERVRTDGARCLAHSGIALGNGKMASNVQHAVAPFNKVDR